MFEIRSCNFIFASGQRRLRLDKKASMSAKLSVSGAVLNNSIFYKYGRCDASMTQASSAQPGTPGGDHALLLAAEELVQEGRKAPSSRYDYVKIKVWLGENHQHYYILSRFLISRMLSVTRVPQHKVGLSPKTLLSIAGLIPTLTPNPDPHSCRCPQAVKIALEVKKWLVDNNKLDISQDELEAVLFGSMRARGFGDEYVDRFLMVNRFQQQKRALIILICGSVRTGKSSIAQQLSARLNLPNVLSTDVLRELLRGYESAPLHPDPLWLRDSLGHDGGGSARGALLREFQEECMVMRRALDGDLVKVMVYLFV